MTGLGVFEDTFVEGDEYPRRHPVRRFFGRLCLALVLVIVVGVCFICRYQPLTNGDVFGVRGDHVRETESVGGSSVVTYGPSESFEVILTVRNTGPVPIRVTSVPDSELAPTISSYDVRVLPRHATGYDSNDAEPFHAFNLRPGEARLLDLAYTFKDCGAPAAAGNRSVRRQTVHYQFGQRLPREASVRLAQPLVITRLPNC